MFRPVVQVCLLLLFATNLLANEKIVLQLKSEHEFQFAGYYAAKWQGYYAEAGLDVEIRPAVDIFGKTINPIKEIENGNADFAIGALDILIGLDRGSELVILASIFQRSQNAIFSLNKIPIDSLSQLAKLRIAIAKDSSLQAEVITLFKSKGYDVDQLIIVDEPATVNSLMTDKADAIATYQISAAIQASEQGVKLNELYPSDFGINFFGDSLITRTLIVESNPQLVNRFLQATRKGWLFVIDNKKSIAQRIAKELTGHQANYQSFYRYNLAFADQIEYLLDYPATSLGNINHQQWITVNEQLRSAGIVHSRLNAENDIYTEKNSSQFWMKPFSKVVAMFVALGLVFLFWYRRSRSITLFCLLIFIVLLETLFEESIQQKQLQASKMNLTRQLNSVSAKLKGNLQSNLSSLTGFAAYISASPNLTADEFRSYAQEVFKKETMLINFAAAKDLIVNYVYPIKGNEKAIGLNYRENEAQKDMVLKIAKSGQMLVVGPVNLVQGGVALIARAPIYIGDGTERSLWGIISAPIDLELLYSYSDVNKTQQSYQLAIMSFDSFDAEGKVILGNKSVFEDPAHVHEIISLGSGTWRLALAPKIEAMQADRTILWTRSFAVLLLLLISIFIIFRFRQEKERLSFAVAIRKNEKLLISVGKVAKIGGWKFNRQMIFEEWSTQASKLIGKDPESSPKTLSEFSSLLTGNDVYVLRHSMQDAFDKGLAFEIDVAIQINNKIEWRRIIADPDMDNKNYINGTIQDITSKIENEKTIQHQATYDALTDLPNRTLFNDRLTHAIQKAKREKTQIAVLFVDLDRFKPVNDNHGHETGDKLLVKAAERILICVRDSDTVSRLSGDEFGVILVDIAENRHALPIIEKIVENMQQPYNIDNLSIHCSASIGIAFYPDDATSADVLISNADQAMYVVKSSGRNGWQFYTEELQKRSEYRHTLLNRLINAVNNDQLTAYYQPIFSLTTLKITKAEALCRWQQTDGSFITPDEFIPIAEESGLVNRIDIAMLKKSSSNLKLLKTENFQIGLSINVSPRLFHTKDDSLEIWMNHVISISKDVKLTVEITERLLTDDTDKALAVLRQLKHYGVKIAIDDFGTGYSSLSYLVKFPVDIIKIDKSFIDQIGRSHSSETLIETIIVMAKKLNIEVIAEGIETQEQLDFLIKNECNFGQGFLLGKPMNQHIFNESIQQTC